MKLTKKNIILGLTIFIISMVYNCESPSEPTCTPTVIKDTLIIKTPVDPDTIIQNDTVTKFDTVITVDTIIQTDTVIKTDSVIIKTEHQVHDTTIVIHYDTIYIDTSKDTTQPPDPWIWPNGAKAAISLSYDDGYANNLDSAMPDLEEHNFRGTFYIFMNKSEMQYRKTDWKAAFERGHEIASHSWYHPCRADMFDDPQPWLTHPLENYTPETIAKEVADAASWLTIEIGYDKYRTYCYPCSHIAIGETPDTTSYDKAIMAYHQAARTGGSRVNDPRTMNMYRIYSFISYLTPVDTLMKYCNKAVSQNGWTVIMMHGVGEYAQLKTTRDVHRDFLDSLDNDKFWVAPIRDVAKYVRKYRPDLEEW